MRHLQQVLGYGNLKHIRHVVVKVHKKKQLIKGCGTSAVKKDYYDEFGSGIHSKSKYLKPLKFKF